MAKWGWAFHFSDPSEDYDYSDCDEEPYDSEDEAEAAAEQAMSDRNLGCGMMHVLKPDEHPELPEDLEDPEIEVFKI